MKKQIILKRTCLGNVVQFTFNLFSLHWRNRYKQDREAQVVLWMK